MGTLRTTPPSSQHHRDAGEAPQDVDPSESLACVNLVQQQVTKDLEVRTTPVNESGAEAVHASLKPRSFSICSLVKPMLERSSHAIRKRRITKGTAREALSKCLREWSEDPLDSGIVDFAGDCVSRCSARIGHDRGSAATLTAAESVGRLQFLSNGVAFTGEFKLVRKPTGYEKSRRPTGTGFAGYASRPSQACVSGGGAAVALSNYPPLSALK
jgi:hypothetical protein